MNYEAAVQVEVHPLRQDAAGDQDFGDVAGELVMVMVRVPVASLVRLSRAIPPPSAVAVLCSSDTLLSTTLAAPWARMPPPELWSASPGAAVPC
jgi:hypothetical protein